MKRGWWIAALVLGLELAVILSRPQESKAVMRTVYQWLWSVAPKPEGYMPPDRFQ